MYEDEIISVIEMHPVDRPLFIYMPFQVTHSPIQPPPRLVQAYNSSMFLGQRKVFAFVTALDESIGRIVQAIKSKPASAASVTSAASASPASPTAPWDASMFDNALIIFTADNGGPLETMSNYPMRGGKFSDFQGGARAASFAAGGLIPASRRGKVLDLYLHVADWLPTFCGLAGVDSADSKGDAAGLPPVDGVDVWPQISGGNTSEAHLELPLSSLALLDTVTGYKIVVGTQRYNMWTPSVEWPPDYNCTDRAASTPLTCKPAGAAGEEWGCLFNVHADPNEHVNLAAGNSEMLHSMQKRYLRMRKEVWQNCDPPSTCKAATPDKYCMHTKEVCGSVYCPMFS
jgi:arylsulfatase I/J